MSFRRKPESLKRAFTKNLVPPVKPGMTAGGIESNHPNAQSDANDDRLRAIGELVRLFPFHWVQLLAKST